MSKFLVLRDTISCGFPSPASDYAEASLDLHELLIEHKSATFFVRVQGDSMINAGILDGDLLIVDRSIQPENNSIVIAVIEGDYTVKRLKKEGDEVLLVPENDLYKPIKLMPDTDVSFWGVVIHAIHTFKSRAK